MSHKNFIACTACIPDTDVKLCSEDVYLSYLPLPHLMERLVYFMMTYHGALIGFSRGDPLLLKEDLIRL